MAGSVTGKPKRLTNAERKSRLKRLRGAMAKAGAKDLLSGKQLAELVGISQARFSAMRQSVKGMPAGRSEGKAILYPAKAALKAIIAHYDRPETEAEARKATVARMLSGSTAKAGKAAPEPDPRLLDPLGYKRLVDAHAVTTEQMQRQRQLVAMDEVRDLITGIYTTMSHFLSSLPNLIDPGGKLPSEQRKRLEEGCRDQQLDLHNRVKSVIGG